MIVTFIVGAISLGMVFLYGCVGEIITEKAVSPWPDRRR